MVVVVGWQFCDTMAKVRALDLKEPATSSSEGGSRECKGGTCGRGKGFDVVKKGGLMFLCMGVGDREWKKEMNRDWGEWAWEERTSYFLWVSPSEKFF